LSPNHVITSERPIRGEATTDSFEDLLVVAHSFSGAVRALQILPGAKVVLAGAGPRGVARAMRAVARHHTKCVWLVDTGQSTCAAGLVARVLNRGVVVDTGDAAFALARSVGGRSARGLLAVGIGERLMLYLADHIVVRGHQHIRYLPHRRATVIPDLPPPGIGPVDARHVKAEWKLEEQFVVGLVGSLAFAPRRGVSYGWDLVESLPQCRNDVVALIVGDGDGRAWLEQRARDLGVHDRCRFVGRVADLRIAEFVSAMDVAISTQSTDIVGQVRTTGKLPLYLSCGTPVIASHSGEAIRILGPVGWTLPYEGVVDRSYPGRLARAIEQARQERSQHTLRRATALRLAEAAFDRTGFRERAQQVLVAVQAHRASKWPSPVSRFTSGAPGGARQ